MLGHRDGSYYYISTNDSVLYELLLERSKQKINIASYFELVYSNGSKEILPNVVLGVKVEGDYFVCHVLEGLTYVWVKNKDLKKLEEKLKRNISLHFIDSTNKTWVFLRCENK